MSGESLLERFGRFFPKGTVIFREGEVGNEMFVVHSGRVDITRSVMGRELPLISLPAGEFFGEMAVVINRPRSGTAVVAEDAWLLVIDSKTFEAMIRGRTEIAVRMIKAMAARIEQANQQIELLLLPDPNHRIVQCLRQMAEGVGQPTQSGGIFIGATLAAIAGRVGLRENQVDELLSRLRQARLVLTAQEAGIEADGFVVPEVGRLHDFLDFLAMKERFR